MTTGSEKRREYAEGGAPHADASEIVGRVDPSEVDAFTGDTVAAIPRPDTVAVLASVGREAVLYTGVVPPADLEVIEFVEPGPGDDAVTVRYAEDDYPPEIDLHRASTDAEAQAHLAVVFREPIEGDQP